jgi:hypothetical protein
LACIQTESSWTIILQIKFKKKKLHKITKLIKEILYAPFHNPGGLALALQINGQTKDSGQYFVLL